MNDLKSYGGVRRRKEEGRHDAKQLFLDAHAGPPEPKEKTTASQAMWQSKWFPVESKSSVGM